MGVLRVSKQDTFITMPMVGGINWAHPTSRGLGLCIPIDVPILGGSTWTNSGTDLAGSPFGHAARSYDTSTDQISYGSPPGDTSAGSTAFTMSCWTYLTDVANTATGRRWVSRWGSNSATSQWLIGQTDGNGTAITAAVCWSGGYSIGQVNSVIVAREWHHWCFRWNGTSKLVEVFLDGRALTTTAVLSAATVINSTARTLTVGQDNNSLNGLLGQVAHVMVWPRRMLSNSEIFGLFDPPTRWSLYRSSSLIHAPIFSKARFDDSHQIIGGPM